MAKVIWRRAAIEMRKSILLYGTVYFGQHAAKKLRLEIRHCVRLLEMNPRMGTRLLDMDSPELEVRKVLISPIFWLVYQVDDAAGLVRILAIWDVRRNPDNLSDIL